MKPVHVVWWAAALLALAAGSFLAIIAVPPAALITLAIATAMAIGLGFRIADEQLNKRRPAKRYLQLAAPGLVVGPALGGMLAVLGFGGLLLVAALAGSSPRVVRFGVRRYRKRHPLPEVSEPALTDRPADLPAYPTEPADLPDEQLFQAWQLSYVLLQHARTTRDRIALVTARQRYLDELERRNPDGFKLWMANGARAASNPGRYWRV
jgi:hypothetical protein